MLGLKVLLILGIFSLFTSPSFAHQYHTNDIVGRYDSGSNAQKACAFYITNHSNLTCVSTNYRYRVYENGVDVTIFFEYDHPFVAPQTDIDSLTGQFVTPLTNTIRYQSEFIFILGLPLLFGLGFFAGGQR